MTRRPRPSAPIGTARLRAFTLVEVLVAITVLSMLATLLAGGVRLAGRAWEAGQQQADESADLRLVHTWLRRGLATAQPVYTVTDGDRALEFAAEPKTLRFVTELPNNVGNGGLHEIRVGYERTPDGGHVQLAHLPFDSGRESRPRDDDYRTVVLSDGIATLDFDYYGAERDSGAKRWRRRWESADRLPELVRVRISTADGGNWPDLVVQLQVTRPPLVVNVSGQAGAEEDAAAPETEPGSDDPDADQTDGAAPESEASQ